MIEKGGYSADQQLKDFFAKNKGLLGPEKKQDFFAKVQAALSSDSTKKSTEWVKHGPNFYRFIKADEYFVDPVNPNEFVLEVRPPEIEQPAE